MFFRLCASFARVTGDKPGPNAYFLQLFGHKNFTRHLTRG